MRIYHFLTFSPPFTSKAKFRILMVSGSQCIVGAQTKGLSHHGDPSILEPWRWSDDRHGSGSWQTAGGSQGQPDLYPASNMADIQSRCPNLSLHSPSFWPIEATPFYTSIYPTGRGCLCETTPLQLSGQIMGLCIWDAETRVQLLI